MAITLRMYAERKGFVLQTVKVELSHKRVSAEDCADCNSQIGSIDQIESVIHLDGQLDEVQHNRLIEIASRCPVHKTLTLGSKIIICSGSDQI